VSLLDDGNWNAKMRAVIDAATADGPYVSRHVARDIVVRLTAEDPELLDGWLHDQAEQLIWAAINERDRAARAAARISASRAGTFAEAADEYQAGDPTKLNKFLKARYVVWDGTRRELATLAHDDLLFVANQYATRSKSNAFEAAFFHALARRVRTGTVKDYFTEEQITALRNSLGT
jgi:hypothetical protein